MEGTPLGGFARSQIDPRPVAKSSDPALAELLGVLPERFVERPDAHRSATRDLAAGSEVLEPEAHRVLRAGLDAERLERADVEDRVVVGKCEVEKGRCRRHPDPLEFE